MDLHNKAIPVKERHATMVAALAKPGKDIMATMTETEIEVIRCLAILSENVNGGLATMADVRQLKKGSLEDPAYYHELHMYIGLAGEFGELLDAIKKSIIYQKPLDVVNCIEEMGDILFYAVGTEYGAEQLEVSYELGVIVDYVKSKNVTRDTEVKEVTIDACLEHNIVKLGDRYKSGSYSDKAAQERADKVEDKSKG